MSVGRGYSPGDILITSLALLASSRRQVRLTSSLTLFSCQLVDDFLGTGFQRVKSRNLGGDLILDRPSERDHAISDRDVNEIGIDIRP